MCLWLLPLLAGCQRERTQIMIGLATDLQAQGEIDEVIFKAWKLDAKGQKADPPTVTQSWTLTDVPSDIYELPGSIGLYSPDGSEPRVFVLVEGKIGGTTLVTRESIFSLVREQTLFMRLTLVSRCMTSAQCSSDTVCIEGDCKPREFDTRRLPAYLPPATGNVGIQVTQLDCRGPVTFINTLSGNAMPLRSGDGTCPVGTFCQEGVCLSLLPGESVDLGTAPSDLSTLTSNNLLAVTGVKNTDGTITLFTGADDGSLYRQDDATNPNLPIVRTLEFKATGAIRALFATPTGEVYAAGDNRVFLRRDTTGTWTALNVPATVASIQGLEGDDAKLMACGFANNSMPLAWSASYADSVLVAETLPATVTASLRALTSPRNGHVYAVGNGRSLLRADAAWAQLTVPPAPADGLSYDFFDVAGPATDHYYIVGSQGQVARINEVAGAFSDLTFEPIATTKPLNTIVFIAATQEWLAAGQDGEIWTLVEGGSGWQQFVTPITDTLHDSWSLDGFAVVVGANGAQYVRAPPSPTDLGTDL